MNEYLKTGRTGQKEKTREKILRAAHQLQQNKGGFSLEKVAQLAGISRATIYRYYSNKDVLSAEAVLHMRTLTPDQILADLNDVPLEEAFMEVQRYYNELATNNERPFRRYLSVLLNEDNQVSVRGARRVRTLSQVLKDRPTAISQGTQEKLVYMATLMMGIEALIVTRDVCQLDAKSSDEVLRWGMKTLLKGVYCE